MRMALFVLCCCWSGTACYHLGSSSSSNSPYLIPIKEILCSYVLFHAVWLFLFLPFLLATPEGRVGEEEPSPLLSCASHFRLDSVVYLKQSHKGQDVCRCLSFLSVPFCSFSSSFYIDSLI